MNGDIDDSAQVHPTTCFDGNAAVGFCSCVGHRASASEPVRVGDGVRIGAFCLIEGGVRLAAHVEVDHYCRISYGTRVGRGTRVLYRAQIFDEVSIGDNCIIAGELVDRTVVEDWVTFQGATAHCYTDATGDWEDTEEPSPIIKRGSVVGVGAFLDRWDSDRTAGFCCWGRARDMRCPGRDGPAGWRANTDCRMAGTNKGEGCMSEGADALKLVVVAVHATGWDRRAAEGFRYGVTEVVRRIEKRLRVKHPAVEVQAKFLDSDQAGDVQEWRSVCTIAVLDASEMNEKLALQAGRLFGGGVPVILVGDMECEHIVARRPNWGIPELVLYRSVLNSSSRSQPSRLSSFGRFPRRVSRRN